jgi:D-tyrosyl-tRNA(Tyr) deacylase
VVQRVGRASVDVAGEAVGTIAAGLLVYAAAAPDDTDEDVGYIADKVAHLRIFPDENRKMNLSVGQACGAVLLVSAFSVQADARRGRRPSFDACAAGEAAAPLIDKLAEVIRGHGLQVATGRFAAYMQVDSINDGPICILLDSRRVV